MALLRNITIFALVAVGVAYSSIRYMVDTGSALTTRRIGPWTVWANAAHLIGDPYTRAHFARNGALPLTSRMVLTYHATTDETGEKLRSRCDYAVKGTGPAAQWWSLSVFNASGKLIANPAERHSFTSTSVLRQPGGSYTISVARQARAGNWLPSMRVGKIMLRLMVQQPRYGHSADSGNEEQRELPAINRITCR